MSDIELKERIAGQFQQHFFHYGFKKTSVDEVAAELKISKKTIYTLFEGKQDIYTYVIQNLARQKVGEIKKQIMQYDSGYDKIENLIVTAIQMRREKIKKFGHPFKDVHEREMSFAIFSNAFYHVFKEVIENGMAKEEFQTCDIEITLRFIQGIMRESMVIMDEDMDIPVENAAKCAILKLLV